MRKSSSISSSIGKVINLLSFDTFRFDTAVSAIHNLWKGPLEVLIFGYFLYKEMGYYAFIGILFIISFVPFQSKLQTLSWHFQPNEKIKLIIFNIFRNNVCTISMFLKRNPNVVILEQLVRRTLSAF